MIQKGFANITSASRNYYYIKSTEKVNNRFFYISEGDGGKNGIWWCEENEMRFWNIGPINLKGNCITKSDTDGTFINTEDAVCPTSIKGKKHALKK